MGADVSFELADEAATRRLGAALARTLRPGSVLFVSGELGAGKTTLVRGLLEALGYRGRVKSPTFTLVELYGISSLNLYHFDLYRFKDKAEWLSSGFRDYFNPDSVCVVEWAERAEGLLPPPDVDVRLDFSGTARRARVSSRSPLALSFP